MESVEQLNLQLSGDFTHFSRLIYPRNNNASGKENTRIIHLIGGVER